jgi:bifunctional non-homologous end joining protein LigD
MRGVALQRSRSRVPAGAQSASMPGYIEPCDPILRKVPPSGDEWLYEIKWDGYRAQVHIHAGDITVYSRKGVDWTDEFAAIARVGRDLRAREAIIHGEAVVLGSQGIADFQALRHELGKEDSERLTFDLLWLNGKDLRGLPVIERKQRLRKLIESVSPRIVYVGTSPGTARPSSKKGAGLGLKASSRSAGIRHTVPASKSPGSKPNAREPTRFQSSHSWRNSVRSQDASPRSISAGGRAIDCFMPARRGAVIRKR